MQLNVEVVWEEDPYALVCGAERLRSFSGWAKYHDIRETSFGSVDFGHIEYLGQRFVCEPAEPNLRGPSWLSVLLSSLSS